MAPKEINEIPAANLLIATNDFEFSQEKELSRPI